MEVATESGGISVFPSSLTPPYTVSPLELSFRDGEVEARGAVSESMTESWNTVICLSHGSGN